VGESASPHDSYDPSKKLTHVTHRPMTHQPIVCSGRRSFHSRGPAAEKLLSPSLLCVGGTSSFRMSLELERSGQQCLCVCVCGQLFGLQCFDAVGWVAGRASGLKKLSGGVLVWLSNWSVVQTCIWPSGCHCHSLSLASVKSRLVYLSGTGLPG